MPKPKHVYNKDKDFLVKSDAQYQMLMADLDDVNEVLLTGPGGTGKTISLLISSMGPQKSGKFLTDNPNYVGFILRREATQLEKSGLIRSATEWYTKFYPRVEYNGSLRRFTFPSGAIINFGGCESEDDAMKYKGFSKLHFLGLEEGTQFTERQIDILTTRLRDADGSIPLRVRISTNAGENEEPLLNRYKYWLWKSCISPLEPSIKANYGDRLYTYIDEEDPNFRKVITKEKPDRFHEVFTCIETKINDVMKNNIQTLGRIQDPILRAQLMDHIWGLKAGAGMYFTEQDLSITDLRPSPATRIRYWDKACSGEKGDFLCGMLVSHYNDGISKFVIEDLVLIKTEAPQVKDLILKTAQRDGRLVYVGLEQEPGSGSKELTEIYKRELEKLGHMVVVDIKKESKLNRAQFISPIAKDSRISYIPGPSSNEMIRQLVNFPSKGVHDDVVDCLSASIFLLLNKLPRPSSARLKSSKDLESLFMRLEGTRHV